MKHGGVDMTTESGESNSTEITEEMLRVAITDYARRHSEPVASYSEVTDLRLESKDIKWIDNLWELTSLTRLDLTDNLIEKIQGLDFLVHLKWLNLSFNSINKIEGLESLEKLEVLNLSNNRISVIENMDSLGKLTHFLCENNLLEKIDTVFYLRKFKNLFTLNLSGNPATKDENYRLLIAAHFPKLKFLDRRLLDENTRTEASVKYSYVIEKLHVEELQIQQATEAQQKQEAELQLHKDAFVENLNGPDLFKSMFVNDPEAKTLHSDPGIASLIQKFEEQMVALCRQLFELGLAEHHRRQTEVRVFLAGQSEMKSDFQRRGSQTLEKFQKEQMKRIEEMQQSSDPDLIEVKINQCNDEIHQLCKSLMTLEFQLVSQIEENIRKLDSSISEMVGNFSEAVQGIFCQCRDLEDDYFKKVQEVALAKVAQVSMVHLDEELPDDVVMLFTDQEAVVDALTTGHDNHVLKIMDRETQFVTRLTAWNATFIKEIKDKELVRNRLHISDIQRYKDYLKEQLPELKAE